MGGGTEAQRVIQRLLGWIDMCDWHSQRGWPKPAFMAIDSEPIFPADGELRWLTATPPEQREPRQRQYSCTACKVQKPRDDYWPEDFDNRAIAKQLVCKRCRPTPPAQRQQRKQGQARSKSAGAVVSHAYE